MFLTYASGGATQTESSETDPELSPFTSFLCFLCFDFFCFFVSFLRAFTFFSAFLSLLTRAFSCTLQRQRRGQRQPSHQKQY